MAEAITLDRVTKKYGETSAVRDLSFAVRAGEMFGLIGPDGAGKTTTIRLMCGLLRVDAGSVRILDRDPARQHREVTQSVGYLSQRFSLYGDLTIDENIAFFAEIHGLRMSDARIRDRRTRLLELTQLTRFRNRLADQLSGGMKQKLALACTLVHEPKIILLDEPTTGVDPVSRREFWKLLSEFLSQGITILMATPYLDEAERCSRVALLHEGGLLALDTPAALRAGLKGDVMEIVAADRDRATDVLQHLPGVVDVQLFGERAHARLAPDSPFVDADRLAAALTQAGIAAESVRHVPTSLEDVFIARVTKSTVVSAFRRTGRGLDMKRVVASLLLWLSVCAPAVAQTPVRLSLQDAIARALEHSHRLAEIGARHDAAEAVAEQRKAASMPQVALLAGYSRTNHVDEFGIPGGRVIYPDIPDNVRSRVDLQWPIYTGGRFAALTRAATAEAGAIEQDRMAARADLRLEITRAYWAVITARASVDVVNQALGRIGAHLNDVRNQLNVGLVPPSDVLSLEAQQARQQQLLIEAENVADTAAMDLRRLVGLDPGAPFELADRIDMPTAASADVEALVDAARANRAERKALEIRLEGLGERVTAADAGRLPVISTAGGYDVARPNPRIFPREAAWKPSWDLGVNVNWSLFDGGRARAEAAEAAANQKAAEERLKDFDANVDEEIRQRASDLASARAAITAADTGVRSATEARRVIAERFSAGVATNTDVIDAQVALLQAELDRTRALANAKLSEARLDRALGR